MMMQRETPKTPKPHLNLLLYTNMGAEALAKYLRTTTTNQRTQQASLEGTHSTTPRMSITTAPAGRQGIGGGERGVVS